MKIHHYQKTTPDAYYVAAFNVWGNAVRGPIELQRRAMRDWCIASFGPAGLFAKNNASARWVDDITWGEVSFLHEKDLTLFLLRWAE